MHGGDYESELIRDRVICGLQSDEVRQHLLRADNLTLDKCLKICHSYEQTQKSVQILTDGTHVVVDGLNKQKSQQTSQAKGTNEKSLEDESLPKYICNNCGRKHAKRQCPPYGQKCHKCVKLNHFGKFCRSKHSVQSVASHAQEDSDSLFIRAVSTNKTELQSDECYTTLNVEHIPVKFKVDTGAQVNILPLHTYLNTQIKLEKSDTKLTTYSNDELCVKGKSRLECEGRSVEFYIVDTQQAPILVGIIKIVLNANKCFIEQYPRLFKGLGCLKISYKIKLDTSVSPVVVPTRNQPAPLRERLKETLRTRGYQTSG